MPKYVVVGVRGTGGGAPETFVVVCDRKKDTDVAVARLLLSSNADEVIVASITKMVKADSAACSTRQEARRGE